MNVESSAQPGPAKVSADQSPPRRLQSLDAYRGLIMITLAFNGFGIARTAAKHLAQNPDSGFWGAVRYQFSHVEWVGCAYWDLIQPSFMFMVGVSMTYSYLRREREGQSHRRMLGHACTRALVLVLLGVFLSSNGAEQTNWSFTNVLSQIGLGYGFLFLLWRRSFRTQVITAVALLVGTWLLFVGCSGAGIDFEKGGPAVQVTAAWAKENLRDVGAAWHKNANVGHRFDVAFLNLFPRPEPFTANRGGYQTLNFLPSLATMLFGLMCGELLRSGRRDTEKVKLLLLCGIGGLVGGQFLNLTGICPLVKRIWTPSWAVFSTGWCCLFLAGLYWLIDVKGWRRWSFPLVVVGMNSIAIYLMGQLLKPWLGGTLRTHLGTDIFKLLGDNWEPFVQYNLIGLCFWLICFWMYRQKIFIRI